MFSDLSNPYFATIFYPLMILVFWTMKYFFLGLKGSLLIMWAQSSLGRNITLSMSSMSKAYLFLVSVTVILLNDYLIFCNI